MRALVAIALVAGACNADIDEQWELDHDRIIAVRAEPPGIMPGEVSRIDMLLGFETLPVAQRGPDFVTVVSPASLSDIVTFDGMDWIVTAPSAERIDQARGELGLLPDAPVPLQIGAAVAWPTPVVSPEGNGFAAVKVVWLGAEYVNPPINGLLIGGAEAPPAGEEIVFAKTPVGAATTVKTRLFVEADDESDIVNWLSSCGTMHDFDLHAAYVTVQEEEDDRTEGELALVLRDELGGVTWRWWPCRAE